MTILGKLREWWSDIDALDAQLTALEERTVRVDAETDRVLAKARSLNRYRIPVEESYPTGPWTVPDEALRTFAPPTIKNAFNIQRVMLDRPVPVDVGQEMTVILRIPIPGMEFHCTEQRTPPFPITRPMIVDSITRFEVIDEFGVDVGLGFVLGQVKK